MEQTINDILTEHKEIVSRHTKTENGYQCILCEKAYDPMNDEGWGILDIFSCFPLEALKNDRLGLVCPAKHT